jgi:hypothetical protein
MENGVIKQVKCGNLFPKVITVSKIFMPVFDKKIPTLSSNPHM